MIATLALFVYVSARETGGAASATTFFLLPALKQYVAAPVLHLSGDEAVALGHRHRRRGRGRHGSAISRLALACDAGRQMAIINNSFAWCVSHRQPLRDRGRRVDLRRAGRAVAGRGGGAGERRGGVRAAEDKTAWRDFSWPWHWPSSLRSWSAPRHSPTITPSAPHCCCLARCRWRVRMGCKT